MTRHRGVVAAVAATVVVLSALAALLADLQHNFTPDEIATDLAVGAVIVASAVLSAPPDRQRLLLAGVAVVWWLLSVPPLALPMRGALVGILAAAVAAVLVAFPDGRFDKRRGLMIAVVLVVAVVSVPLSYVVLAVVAAAQRRTHRWPAYPVVAAAALATISLLQWASAGPLPWMRVTSSFWSHAFEVALVLVAVLHVPASRRIAADRAEALVGRLVDRSGEGADPLVAELRAALGDERLRLVPWDPHADAYVDTAGVERRPGPGAIEVLDGQPLVLVESASPMLVDPGTARQVQDAVRLTVRAQHRQQERVRQLAELTEARRRLLAAADDERSAMARRLEAEVLPQLRRAAETVETLEQEDSLDVVRSELALVEDEIALLVAGSPPTELGDGRLAEVLGDLMARTSLVSELVVAPSWSASPDVERTFFYVASEAVANILKHAHATTVRLELAADGDDAVLSICDDGVGGADPTGLGLTGLTDRMAAVGGTLAIDDRRDAGTRLVARAPRRAVS